MPSKAHKDEFYYEIGVFRRHRGVLRTSEAIRRGIHPRDFYDMKASGAIEPISRGLYRLTDMAPLSQPDLATVSLKIPQGVICLVSALAFHEITTQIPHEVYVALKQGAEKPRLNYPPTRFVWLSELSFGEGVETQAVDGIPIKVYGPEKTVADCFKFRNRIGLDVAIEALKLCRKKYRSTPDRLMKYARICRVERVMKPYLEAIL